MAAEASGLGGGDESVVSRAQVRYKSAGLIGGTVRRIRNRCYWPTSKSRKPS